MMEQNFIENNIIILSKQTIDEFLKQDNPVDLIGLYSFYYYTAKWQNTNQPKCTTSYVANGLHKSQEWVKKNKKILINMGLIQDIINKDSSNKITGWYIKLNYIWKQETLNNHPLENPPSGIPHPVENEPTNALSAVNLNALSAVNLNALSANINNENLETTIYKTIIDGFYQYHNKQYNFSPKEYGIAKRLSKKLILNINWKDILQQKINGLLQKIKDNPKFWSFTISKLEYGWNEFNYNQNTSINQTKQIFEHLRSKGVKC